jgi:small conductance mechanosensitive channel
MFTLLQTSNSEYGLNDWFDDHGWPILVTVVGALVLVLLMRIIVPRVVRGAVARQMVGRPEVEVDRRVQTLSGVIVRTGEFAFGVMAVFTILPEFGLDIRALLAGVSITSIAIGFGAQSLVKDALNGIFILSENQYAVGDIVTVAGVTGTVEDITLRRTVLRDIDGVLHSIPNGTITTSSNFTRDFAKVRVMIPVAPASDLEKVREVADRVGLELAADEVYGPMILQPPKYLRIDNIDMMGGVAVNVNGTVAPGKQWEVAGALRARLLEAFQREGIKTPWG